MRAGDTVLHLPSGERWTVGAIVGGNVIPLGWPLTYARVEDCQLEEEASDEEHDQLLWRLANMDGSDPRKHAAQTSLQGDTA